MMSRLLRLLLIPFSVALQGCRTASLFEHAQTKKYTKPANVEVLTEAEIHDWSAYHYFDSLVWH